MISVLMMGSFGVVSAQSQTSSVEVYIGGKKYESVDEYKKEQLRAILEPETKAVDPYVSIHRGKSDKFITSFLDITLEKFNDAELREFIKQLRERRSDLFKDFFGEASVDYDFIQVQKMMGEYIKKGGKHADIELDPGMMKTIVIPNPSSELQAEKVKIPSSEVSGIRKVIKIPPKTAKDQKKMTPSQKTVSEGINIDDVLPFKTIMKQGQ